MGRSPMGKKWIKPNAEVMRVVDNEIIKQNRSLREVTIIYEVSKSLLADIF